MLKIGKNEQNDTRFVAPRTCCDIVTVMNEKIGVIGLGYVGLPLALAFAKHGEVIGFDINRERIASLRKGLDRTGMTDTKTILGSKQIQFADQPEALGSCTVFIITVPTPVDAFKSPDLRTLHDATRMVGRLLKHGDLVIYESTVYPGCTEETCVPILEKESGLVYRRDFSCGYSPERINPGDQQHRLEDIRKITSGSDADAASRVDALYRRIITAGTHLAPSIAVAEAAKAIENAQRDVNISFVNELALIFDRMGIDTHDVLEAAATKWNFLPFKPGLVGGHCIGVDPYYLAHKAKSLGYHPQVILSGRRVNDAMGLFVAGKVVKLMIRKGLSVKGAKALVLGITYKENCADVRNTKVVDIVQELQAFGMSVDVYDPIADGNMVQSEYAITLISKIDQCYEAIILTVAHDAFKQLDIHTLKSNTNAVVFDTRAFFDRKDVDGRL